MCENFSVPSPATTSAGKPAIAACATGVPCSRARPSDSASSRAAAMTAGRPIAPHPHPRRIGAANSAILLALELRPTKARGGTSWLSSGCTRGVDHASSRRSCALPADFSSIDFWVFDLDNTLYPASAGFSTRSTSGCGRFLRARFGCDDDEAHAIQKGYYRSYGTTLNGLMQRARRRSARVLGFRARDRRLGTRAQSATGRAHSSLAWAQGRVHQRLGVACRAGDAAARARRLVRRRDGHRRARVPAEAACRGV